MSESSSTHPRAAAWRPMLSGFCLAAVAAVMSLSGCQTTPTSGSSSRVSSPYDPPPRTPAPVQSAAPAPAGAGRDITTASDESEVRRRARIRMELATAYYAQGQMATALDELKQGLAIDPSLPGGYNLRGLIYDAIGNDTLAEESFTTALRQYAQDGSTLHNYAWFLCRRKEYERADDLFNRALAAPQYRDAAQTLLVQGVCQMRAGRWEAAEKALTHSYELGAGNPATATNLANVLYHRGEYERARFYIRRVNGVPDLSNAETLWLAARIENKLGNYSGRDDLGDQLRARFPKSPEATAFERKQFED